MKRVYSTLATGEKHLGYYKMMAASFKRFNPNEELILFSDKDVAATNDPNFLYRSVPFIANNLLNNGYDAVCHLDSDMIITGNLDHIWEGDYDVAVVNNGNPRETKTQLVTVWDIHPFAYVNNGMVVLKGKEFVKHWLGLSYSPHFDNYQYKEQDLLNILVFYGNSGLGGPYKVRFLDRDSNKWHGLVAKQYESQMILRDGKLILPKNEEWNKEEDKEIVCWHSAGGHNSPEKMNWRIRFQPEVSKWIDGLVKEKR